MDFSSLLSGAGKGAMAGMALGPIGVAAGAVLGAAPGLLDVLGIHLFGSQGEAVAGAALSVVKAVTGKSDPTPDDVAGLPPDQMVALKVQLASVAATAETAKRQADVEEIKAYLDSQSDARHQTVQLAQVGSHIAWGAPIISTLVIVMFGVMLYLVMAKSIPEGSQAVANLLLGALSASFTGVVAYWVGSTAGSARKTELLAASTPPGQ